VTTHRIFGTVGTDHHPFPRFLEWVSQAGAQFETSDVVLQRGSTPAIAGIAAVEFMSAVDMEAELLAATSVVCHGGPGTISAVRKSGHLPLVIPRDPSRGEHVDDHQMRFCAHTAQQGRIVLISSVDQLVEHVGIAIAGRAPKVTETGDSVAAALRFGTLVSDLVAEKLAPRPFRQRLLFRRIP
jgi:UDP-N-acetylglucosamine transferase subunit ALG13